MRRLLLCAFVLLCLPAQLWGGLVAYDFAGTFSNGPTKTLFGVTINSLATIAGRFYYETTTSRILDTATGGGRSEPTAWYLQSKPNGFSATIAGTAMSPVTIQASNYAITVDNNRNFPLAAGGLADGITIIYSSFTALAALRPPTPLVVNTVDYTSASFSISLRGSANLYGSSALPAALIAGNHTLFASISLNQPAQPPTSAVTAQFSFDGLTAATLPEPATASLLAWGLPLLVGLGSRLRRKQK